MNGNSQAIVFRRALRGFFAHCRLIAWIAAVVVIACASLAPPAHAEMPGLRLSRDVVPLSYEPRLTIDPATEKFSAVIEIHVRVDKTVDVVWLNARGLDVQEVHVRVAPGGSTAGSTVTPGRVVSGRDDLISLQFDRPLPVGPATLVLRYSGSLESVSAIGAFRQQDRGAWYVFTQFEPLDARRVFPCFDQPDFKSSWKLTLVIPGALRAFANMPVARERDAQAGWREVTFADSPPLPSYLVAFAIGDFEVVDGGKAGLAQTPISIITPKGRAGEAAYAAKHTGAILAATEAYFGQAYPFPKLDLIAYPKSTFGLAMENAGLVTYTSRVLLARPDEVSQGFEQLFIAVTAHEIAHMWFGDYVTMTWWDDLWLNESFASWMASTITAQLRPDWNRQSWRSGERYRAMDGDRLVSARRIRQPVNEVGEVRAAFDRITYSKGESILTMFEQWMGPDKFRDGVRRYIARYPWGNATADDFFSALAQSDDALVPALRGFIDRSGFPLVDVSLDCTGPPSIRVSQQQFRPVGATPPGTERWVFPACFEYGDRTTGRQQCALISETSQSLALKTDTCPQWVIANRSGVGYFLPRLTPSLYAALPSAGRVLAPADYEPLLIDMNMLAHSGALPYSVVLPLAAAQANNVEDRSARRAFDVVASVPRSMVASGNRAKFARWIRKHYGARAHRIGWLPRKGESADMPRLREVALPLAAERGEDAALARQALQLTQDWLRERVTLPVEIRDQVLVTAARTAGADAPALFDALLRAALKSSDANLREDLLKALGSFPQRPLLSRALALNLDPAMNARESTEILEQALKNAGTRGHTLSWMQANWTALAARAPREQQGFWPTWAKDACTVAERELFVALFESRMAGLDAGARSYRQSLEKIDLCLALRAAQDASFNAFLAKIR